MITSASRWVAHESEHIGFCSTSRAGFLKHRNGPACYSGQDKNAPRQRHCGGSFAETDPDPDGAEGELDQGDQHDFRAGHMS